MTTALLLSALEAELTAGQRLDKIAPAVFNIMVIPDLVTLTTDQQVGIFPQIHSFCEQRQAFFILDPPGPASASAAGAPSVDSIGSSPTAIDPLMTWADEFLTQTNVAAATYYPWIQISDPVTNLPRFVPPSGSVAGVYATTDTNRGVWKAPAGTEATLQGVSALADLTISDEQNGDLNVVGINCLRTFPLYGSIVWGARTLAGSTLGGNAFTYISSRRLADYIEQSLQQSLKWAVFEPNGPALWSSIQLEVTSFMAGLFGAGAFAGASAAAAYSVACDASTTSPTDMLLGKVNVNVAFAPVDPAEFVMLNVQIDAASAAS
jgi:phage tail sheath protein FI